MSEKNSSRNPNGSTKSLNSLKCEIDIEFSTVPTLEINPTRKETTFTVRKTIKQSSSTCSFSDPSFSTVSAAVSSDSLTKNRTTPIRSVPSKSHLFLLYIIVFLQFGLFLAELITDQFLHSLLILTDSYHHLFNCCNAILLLVCCKISDQVTIKNTFGWVRLELLGLLTTMTFIVALIFSLLIEGLLQIMHLHEIADPTNVKILAFFGVASMIVNVLQVLIINCAITAKNKFPDENRRTFSMDECKKTVTESKKESNKNLNETQSGIGLEIMTKENSDKKIIENEDILAKQDQNTQKENELSTIIKPERRGSLNVSLGPISASKTEKCSTSGLVAQGIASPALLLLGALGIYILENHELVEITDPILGIVGALFLCVSFFPQLKSTTFILMQTIPENLNILLMKREILEKFEVIHNVHEVHIWRLTAENVVATCHIVLPSMSTTEYSTLFTELQSFLRLNYGIGYVTIQPEFFESTPDYDRAASPVSADACLMQCSNPSTLCRQLSCCTNDEKMKSVMIDTQDSGHGHSHSHGHGHSHSHHKDRY